MTVSTLLCDVSKSMVCICIFNALFRGTTLLAITSGIPGGTLDVLQDLPFERATRCFGVLDRQSVLDFYCWSAGHQSAIAIL